MNMMTQFNHNQKRMTSFEISELCQKRHDNVNTQVKLTQKLITRISAWLEKGEAA